jgi:hypothetical protein
MKNEIVAVVARTTGQPAILDLARVTGLAIVQSGSNYGRVDSSQIVGIRIIFMSLIGPGRDMIIDFL